MERAIISEGNIQPDWKETKIPMMTMMETINITIARTIIQPESFWKRLKLTRRIRFVKDIRSMEEINNEMGGADWKVTA